MDASMRRGEKLRSDLLEIYPNEVAKTRGRHIVVNTPNPDRDDNAPEIEANVRTLPGVITQRGCCYAGSKGVVLGPTRDVVCLTHGPIGCGYYAWLTRRNQTRPESADEANFVPYCFTTDMQEREVIFGGEKKLQQAIQEAYDIFKPKAIAVFATCPVGLIGDDVQQICKTMKQKLGINVFGFDCEGYRGVSQSAGHHIANNQLFKHVIGRDDRRTKGKFQVALLGEYNIGGDAFLIGVWTRAGAVGSRCMSTVIDVGDVCFDEVGPEGVEAVASV